MCLIDTKEVERVAQTHDNLKDLAVWANLLIRRLVNEGYTPFLDDNDPFEYPVIEFTKKETL